MRQWKAMTRGGRDYRITTRDPDSDYPIRGEVEDSGCVVCVQWTEDGRAHYDPLIEHEYDLIPIEPEAPSTAKVRVDLALAAHSLRAAVVEFQRCEDQKDNLARVLSDAFAGSRKTEVVVKIEGDHYYFWTENAKVFFRKIEVL
jgi:hypothetical protein